MLNRRQLLKRSVDGCSMVAFSQLVPGFVANTACAAETRKQNVLVIVEMTGGNDGLNTVVPYADDDYQKARPTLRFREQEVVRIDERVGLNPGMRSLKRLYDKGQLAIVQGVGYPNPNRSHFESMDVWQSADPKRQLGTGWLGRSAGSLKLAEGAIPAIHIGTKKLPLALHGSAMATPTIHPGRPLQLDLGIGGSSASRSQLVRDVAEDQPEGGDLLQFVRQSSLQTYATIDQLRELLKEQQRSTSRFPSSVSRQLSVHLNLVARMIQSDFGTRIFYVAISGFDTHANQRQAHQTLVQQLADGINNLFTQLERTRTADRVLLLTFSEFGRRVKENGSKGTDHGAGSSLFIAGPAVKGGLVGKHPSLANDDLIAGDLKYHIDFRQVYATVLDRWLGCDSRQVLGAKFEHVGLLSRQS